ncbi:MAG: hypothetical protein U5L04_00835 [Trueperaceae bacterium]|nr:hypothetical protein [Trueperaceae bacterium]
MTMRFDYFFLAHAFFTLATALLFLAFPESVLLMFSDQATPALLVVTRLLGAAFVGIGGVAFAASRFRHLEAKRGVAVALLFASLGGLGTSLYGVLTGTVAGLTWAVVGIYLTLSVGYGAFSIWAKGRADA